MSETNHIPVAIITGASAGIGRAIALCLARKRYAVVLASRRQDRLDEVAELCRQAGSPKALAVVTDVAIQNQVESLVQRTFETFGRIDVLINNAGYGIFSRVHETSPEQMKAIFDVNYFGVFYGCRAAAPIMIRQRSGHIFNVSSVIGKRGTPFHGAYCATKFAVVGLSDSLRVEMQPYGVRVTTVCPGLTSTEFFDHSQGGGAAKSSFVRIKRMMPPEPVAEKVVASIGRNHPELVFTSGGKLLVVIAALWPKLADRMMKYYHDDLVKNMQSTQASEGEP